MAMVQTIPFWNAIFEFLENFYCAFIIPVIVLMYSDVWTRKYRDIYKQWLTKMQWPPVWWCLVRQWDHQVVFGDGLDDWICIKFFNFAFYSYFHLVFMKSGRIIKNLVTIEMIFFRAFIPAQSQPPNSHTSEVIAAWSGFWWWPFSPILPFCLSFCLSSFSSS